MCFQTICAKFIISAFSIWNVLFSPFFPQTKLGRPWSLKCKSEWHIANWCDKHVKKAGQVCKQMIINHMLSFSPWLTLHNYLIMLIKHHNLLDSGSKTLATINTQLKSDWWPLIYQLRNLTAMFQNARLMQNSEFSWSLVSLKDLI